ncbi:MAG: M24 family metallopeptidase [Halobacteriaceae archaeon]
MDPDFDPLDAGLADLGVDSYLIDDGSEFANQRYLSGFGAERFVTLYTPEQTALLVPGLEFARARSESRADIVRRFSDYDYSELRESEGREAARQEVLRAFVAEFGVEGIAVPGDLPLRTGDALREAGYEIVVDTDDLVGELRATKAAEEVDNVRAAQAANEAAMARAEELLDAATVEDGQLIHDGEPLTSERVRQEIEVTLIRHGCSLDETIVACGADGAEPHNRGSGPLVPGEPIVIDIFPQDKSTKYHADMTRTFVVGEPTEAAQAFHEHTMAAMEAAFEALEPGTTGEAVHEAVCDVYEAAGYPTLRSDEGTETGFIHSTGHGVGLDVHEQPSLGDGGDTLEPGHVVTIEPGLYDPEVGGVRVEDLVLVTEDGYENLTDYHYEFAL